MRSLPIGQSLFVMNFKPILAQEAGFVRIRVEKLKKKQILWFPSRKADVCTSFITTSGRGLSRGRHLSKKNAKMWNLHTNSISKILK